VSGRTAPRWPPDGSRRLERQLSATIMRGGAKPAIRKLAPNELLTEQDQPGDDIYLLLDGVLSVWVDGTQVGELGPGAVAGERALLEGGRWTATLRAATGCVIATAAKDQIDRNSLTGLAELDHREDAESNHTPPPFPGFRSASSTVMPCSPGLSPRRSSHSPTCRHSTSACSSPCRCFSRRALARSGG
jgi:hypothetical protein